MIPIDQTKAHSEKQNGNCLAASLASILEIPLAEIPEFENMNKEEWFPKMLEWLISIGFDLIQWRQEVILPGYYLVMGPSPRGDFNHQVIYKNGTMVHDPHPSRLGVTRVTEVMALLPLDPATKRQRPGTKNPND